MGKKSSPIGFRVGVTQKWKTCWFSDANYGKECVEDFMIRKEIYNKFPEAGITDIFINKILKNIVVYIFCNKPSLIIGKEGNSISILSSSFEKTAKKNVFIYVKEENNKKRNAKITADFIIQQIVNRKPYKKVIKQAISDMMAMRVDGIKVHIKGRLNGAEIARGEKFQEGRIPLNTLSANIDYCCKVAHTEYGTIGVKVWINKGNILEKNICFFENFNKEEGENLSKKKNFAKK